MGLAAAIVATLLAQAAAQQPAKKPRPGSTRSAPAQPAPRPQFCTGDYADTLPPEKANSTLDAGKEPFVFAIRNTATYEHVYYGRDGKLRRNYLRSVEHGTGFGYRALNGETLLVTNEHVASQPEVTDEDHPVEGIPAGSKKVREQLKIVRDESDDYEPGHIPLTRVLSDPAADIAIVKAKKMLGTLPWHLGRSSQLRPGNLVYVRGFPLGAFAALNTGKVLNPYTADTEKGWNHSDFIVDALLNSGNSGSPVLAVSCRTGEPELVGVYHAGYTEAAALNAVIGIDQLREELDTLKVPKRDVAAKLEITAQDRDALVKSLFDEQGHSVMFPFGGRSVLVQLVDPSTLRFAILDDEYPLVTRQAMALVDRAENGFGTLDSIAVSVDGQLTEAPAQALEGDVREHFDRLYDSLWRQLLGVTDYRARLAKGRLSADAFADAQAARARIKKRLPEQKELLGICVFEADRANFGAQKPGAVPVPVPTPAVVDDTEEGPAEVAKPQSLTDGQSHPQ